MFNTLIFLAFLCREQPPSGGCVLKRLVESASISSSKAAAFGRLCVETVKVINNGEPVNAAAFGRLCVETLTSGSVMNLLYRSRLRAAVC